MASLGAGRGAAVIVMRSRTASAAASPERSGPILVGWFREHGYGCADPLVVENGDSLRGALGSLLVDRDAAPRFIVTSGGTGLNPRDRTPQITAEFLDFEVPGVMHALWTRGLTSTPSAAMSRGLAGVVGRSFVVNLPGSRGGVRDGVSVLTPLLAHIQEQLEDSGTG